MLGRRAALERANPVVPLTVAGAGLILFLVASRWIGAGVAIGALLAYVNMLVLSGRVEVAADSGDVARALMVMQLGLLVTFTIVALAVVILVHFSLTMAVSAAAGFAVAQMAMLAVFYWTKGRTTIAAGRQAT